MDKIFQQPPRRWYLYYIVWLSLFSVGDFDSDEGGIGTLPA